VAPPEYAGALRTSRYVALRDGVRLALDVYLPQGLAPGARLPTILEQTRYVRGYELRPEAREGDRPRRQVTELVTRGYAYVVVDVRGTGASFGSRRAELSQLEVRDGAEVVDWIVAQPWSNGKVGATGISYVGTTAELLLGNRHPSVVAVAPQFALYDSYLDIVFPGGIHQAWFSQTWRQAIHAMDENRPSPDALEVVTGTRPVDDDADGSLLAQAIREHAKNHDVYAELSRIAFRDDLTPSGWTLDDLSPHNFLDNARAAGAAVYSYSGWWDGAYPHAAIKRHLTLGTPGSRLVLGPWTHGGRFVHLPGAGVMRSSFDHTRELLRFFEHHLKGLDTCIAAEPAVRYYTMGENRWKAAEGWPPPAQERRWYLAPDQALSSQRPPAGTTFDTYRVDP
ncbi:MAG: CocE/NonD family hydrolase, partial [bacterium]